MTDFLGDPPPAQEAAPKAKPRRSRAPVKKSYLNVSNRILHGRHHELCRPGEYIKLTAEDAKLFGSLIALRE